MQGYVVVYQDKGQASTVVVMTKNIYGQRLHGQPHAPMVWNSAGQVVVSGGGIGAKGKDNFDGAMREFYEETGIDLSDPVIRGQMGCTGAAQPRYLQDAKKNEFFILYQQVRDVGTMVGQIQGNIAHQQVLDDELHDVFSVKIAEAYRRLGPPNLPLDGWRKVQYNQLTPNDKKLADQKMQDSSDWFTIAFNQMPVLVNS